MKDKQINNSLLQSTIQIHAFDTNNNSVSPSRLMPDFSFDQLSMQDEDGTNQNGETELPKKSSKRNDIQYVPSKTISGSKKNRSAIMSVVGQQESSKFNP